MEATAKLHDRYRRIQLLDELADRAEQRLKELAPMVATVPSRIGDSPEWTPNRSRWEIAYDQLAAVGAGDRELEVVKDTHRILQELAGRREDLQAGPVQVFGLKAQATETGRRAQALILRKRLATTAEEFESRTRGLCESMDREPAEIPVEEDKRLLRWLNRANPDELPEKGSEKIPDALLDELFAED